MVENMSHFFLLLPAHISVYSLPHLHSTKLVPRCTLLDCRPLLGSRDRAFDPTVRDAHRFRESMKRTKGSKNNRKSRIVWQGRSNWPKHKNTIKATNSQNQQHEAHFDFNN